MVFQHIAEFLTIVNTDESSVSAKGNSQVISGNSLFFMLNLGLGYFSEQSSESMHHDAKLIEPYIQNNQIIEKFNFHSFYGRG